MSNAVNAAAASFVTTVAEGETVEVGAVRIHRFRDCFQVTELVGAGKRGKRVRVGMLAPGYAVADEAAWMNATAKAVVCGCESFDDVRRFVADLLLDYPGEYRLSIREARGVDVPAAGFVASRVRISSPVVDVDATAADFSVKVRTFGASTRFGAANDNGAATFVASETRFASVDRAGAQAFHAWARANQAALPSMDACAVRAVLRSLAVRFDVTDGWN
jgi:hypothetical protein